MPIHIPGKRDRHNRKTKGTKRKAVAILSLTAMVDMFTVLTIFLLQNFSSTGEILHIPKNVVLPKAGATKELSPAHVVTISDDGVMLDGVKVAEVDDVEKAKDWVIPGLFDGIKAAFEKDDLARSTGVGNTLKKALKQTKQAGESEEDAPERKVTIQADKGTKIVTIKKILNTLSLGGAMEMNFAVEQSVRRESEG